MLNIAFFVGATRWVALIEQLHLLAVIGHLTGLPLQESINMFL